MRPEASSHPRTKFVLLCATLRRTVTRDELIAAVDALHGAIDVAAKQVAAEHGARLVCARGCFGCCVDDLTVFEVEAEAIRDRFPDLLAGGTPAPEGACAFLGPEGECRVYEARPYVCRTQGLPLRWIDDEQMAEFRDICELNEEGEPVEELSEESCWTIGPFEERLASLQEAYGGNLTRVRLRDLMRRG